MKIAKNSLKAALAEGKTQIGLWSQLANPFVVEMIAGAGFDWIGLDAEHGPSDLVGIYHQLHACLAAGSSHPMVRLPSFDKVAIKQYLDIGVQTLLIPQVDSADMARAIVKATRYAPAGERGYCNAPRASNFGRVKDYPFVAADELFLIAQPESMLAVENLPAMVEVDGIDAFFFGPGDLSADMGHLHQGNHPEIVDVLSKAARVVRDAGKAAGIICSDEALTRRYIDMGFNIVAVGSDQGLLVKGADALAARFRQA
ncbi:HpcH/HpaI aldolase family protein [Consotaella salsifontis]|uniref:2,4-dihydroxyhept-2-enedioate aldolase n=1 Tax=Consotaella salsifontis TaxID=1365950 RepID=A0A1T4LI47_9HYPH|nr:HpcH/HpaI aldolase/citrate lyase family protein [Consotaella salsifontis]SJZ54403.1 2,4-dihydroxyhept-2-enedioate aldolase [Consotaella salsifontis]